jgi:holo-[acyl-carrier protein] synthase
MILGIGVDIVEVDRIEKAVRRFGDRFLKRVFTDQEIAYSMGKIHPYQKLAVRFAAKEAAFKALGTGVTSWKEAETTIEPSGKPNMVLSGGASDHARDLGAVRSFVSASDTAQHAVAVVVLES